MQQHILQRVYVKNNDDKTLDVKCGRNRKKKMSEKMQVNNIFSYVYLNGMFWFSTSRNVVKSKLGENNNNNSKSQQESVC